MKKMYVCIVALIGATTMAMSQEPDAGLYKEIVAAQQKNEVKLPLEVLEQYVGEYAFEFKEGFSIKFFIKNGDFMSQATGQDAHFMIAQGKHKFIPADFPSVATFIANDKGIFDRLIITQSGKDFEAKRID